MSRPPLRGWPVRYLAHMPNQPLVGYNTARSDEDALEQACWTARQNNGRVEAEYADGSFDVIRDWSWQGRRSAGSEPADNQQVAPDLQVGFSIDPAAFPELAQSLDRAP